ncbi:ISM-like protein [Mya arenaria]|uniref:ISM-like protein n=1 Tax=Mya arenaria TaxID=6604 RepID=A0ABY7FEZ0_MYAAR|nr:ISM-like protein [Mya arenaria]
MQNGNNVANTNTINEFYKWESDDFVPPLDRLEHNDLDIGSDVCGNWVECNSKFAQDFINNATLPGCPCIFPLIRVKTKHIFDVTLDTDVTWLDSSGHDDLVYKPGAKACMRSTLASGTTTLAVQQCCYDDTYMLVTRGRAAGTPMLISPEISEELHYKIDLLPWVICKGDWTRYNQVLPPNNDFRCAENPNEETLQFQKSLLSNY